MLLLDTIQKGAGQGRNDITAKQTKMVSFHQNVRRVLLDQAKDPASCFHSGKSEAIQQDLGTLFPHFVSLLIYVPPFYIAIHTRWFTGCRNKNHTTKIP